VDGWILERIDGRVKNSTLRSDGRVVTPAEVDDAIASAPSEQIVSYQLEQARADELSVRVTTTGPLDAGAIASHLRDLYGESSRVAVETVDALVPEPSGKYVSSRSLLEVDRDAWFEPLERGA
jgi:hypothetical protein